MKRNDAPIKLYRGNMIDDSYEMTPAAIAEAFWKSPQGQDALAGTMLERALRYFIGTHNGLNSTWEEEPAELVHDAAYERIHSAAIATRPKADA